MSGQLKWQTGQVDTIVIHCVGDELIWNGAFIDPTLIDKWHAAGGMVRKAEYRERWNPHLAHFGYHAMIDPAGGVHTGRGLDEQGEHVKGHNNHTWGVLFSGATKWTYNAWWALRGLVLQWNEMLGDPIVCGHRDFANVKKTCPNFDVAAWVKNSMEPLPECVLEVKK